MTEVSAKFRRARISPQKVRIAAKVIRGMGVESAVNTLTYSNKKSSRLLLKVVESAVANAEHNAMLDIDELVVGHVFVDEGSQMKRWRPRAKGRSARIKKRTSHITVVLSDQKGAN